MESPIISIIIPVYNVEKYLERCMNSVMNQTYRNLEIIIVDDGSTDSCPQMCDEFSEKDSRIRVIHKKNGGLSSARNAGIDVASGDFLMFVDSDDYIALETCEKIAECISEEVDIISFAYKRVYDDETKNEKIKTTGSKKKICGKGIFQDYINRTSFTHMVCDKAVKKTLFDKERFIEGRLAEDMAMCYKLLGRSKCAVCLDEVLYYYYIRSNSIMGKGSLKLFLDAYKGEIEAYEYGNKYFPEFKLDNDTRLLNQSMKTYLKLTMIHGESVSEEDLKIVSDNINSIAIDGMPLKTKLFYIVFKSNKKLAWWVFKLMKLS